MKNCVVEKCERQPKWKATFEFRSHENSEPTPWTFEAGFCDYHKSISHPDNLLSQRAFEIVVAEMRRAGKESPRRSLTTINWNRL